MRIEMKKNPDPISTIEIKRENQNTKFLFFVCGMEKKRKKSETEKKEKKRKESGAEKEEEEL